MYKDFKKSYSKKMVLTEYKANFSLGTQLIYSNYLLNRLSSLFLSKGYKSQSLSWIKKAICNLKGFLFTNPIILWKFNFNKVVKKSFFFRRIFNKKANSFFFKKRYRRRRKKKKLDLLIPKNTLVKPKISDFINIDKIGLKSRIRVLKIDIKSINWYIIYRLIKINLSTRITHPPCTSFYNYPCWIQSHVFNFKNLLNLFIKYKKRGSHNLTKQRIKKVKNHKICNKLLFFFKKNSTDFYNVNPQAKPRSKKIPFTNRRLFKCMHKKSVDPVYWAIFKRVKASNLTGNSWVNKEVVKNFSNGIIYFFRKSRIKKKKKRKKAKYDRFIIEKGKHKHDFNIGLEEDAIFTWHKFVILIFKVFIDINPISSISDVSDLFAPVFEFKKPRKKRFFVPKRINNSHLSDFSQKKSLDLIIKSVLFKKKRKNTGFKIYDQILNNLKNILLKRQKVLSEINQQEADYKRSFKHVQHFRW